ncbi:hypothetical protein D3C86_882630 [compost metagenome]
MPTDTKNSTAKASRSGSDSCAARWLNCDSRITMPAKKAPSANDTPNSAAEAKAMLTAAATTHSVNSSREPVRVTCQRIHGNTRRPTTSISTTKPPTCSSVRPSVCQTGSPLVSTLVLPSAPASGGSSTSTSTIARSSTTSQPTAMRPVKESRMPRLSSARSSTTVLATDSASPNTSAVPQLQPHHMASPPPSSVATAICAMAPGSAILRTASRSASEKCRPTPNISSITPISASCAAMPASATKPGVNGPMITPARRYPTSAGNRSRAARKPNTSANPRPAAIVLMRETLWGIGPFCRNGPQPLKPAGFYGPASTPLRKRRELS